jgi:two-component system, sensor histidine kinase and response regulator
MTQPEDSEATEVGPEVPVPGKPELKGFAEALRAPQPSRTVQDILLVDDHEENLLALEAILGHLGHNLIRARSGREALRHILQRDVALVLLDVRMPHMSGFETARLIRDRERSRALPIIFLTAANSTEEMVFEGYSSGGVDYIVKPFVPEILRAKVDVFLNLAAARKKLEEEVLLRRAAEKELEKTAESLRSRAIELEAANQELEAFAYSASHDLRGPLRHISGFVRLLAESTGEKLDDTDRAYLDRVSRSAQKMGKLLDDLLAFSKMGREEMNHGLVDFNLLVEEAMAELEPETRDRHILFRCSSLPSLQGDEAMLRQVMVNLLSNAIKYTAQRAPAEIEVGHYEEHDEIVIFVRDNGAGFNMKHYDKLFRVFQRLHNESQFPGTGIGLANVQRIVHRHRGRVWAEAKVGSGATFHVALPHPRSEESPVNGF